MDRMSGKVALVTGAARGLGAAIARRFHDEGATLIINDLDRIAAEKLAAELDGSAIAADVSDSSAVRALFAQVAQQHGRLDVLVNNAGISGTEGDPEQIARFGEVSQEQTLAALDGRPPEMHLDVTPGISDEEWRRMLGVHLDGTFYCCRSALEIMSPQLSGSIINMGSIMGTSGGAAATAYCAAKAGILGLTRALARETASRNIRVNAIAPGWIETDMTAPLASMHPMIRAQTPLGRLGQPDDIAWAAVYLGSDEAGFVTGQVLSPNGGWTMNQ